VHDQILNEYPDDLLEEHYRLSALVVELVNRFTDGIIIQVIDPQSVLGVFKSLRYRVRKYPTFIINGQEVIRGWDRQVLDSALEASSTPNKIAQI
jgi:hypothetical protein